MFKCAMTPQGRAAYETLRCVNTGAFLFFLKERPTTSLRLAFANTDCAYALPPKRQSFAFRLYHSICTNVNF